MNEKIHIAAVDFREAADRELFESLPKGFISKLIREILSLYEKVEKTYDENGIWIGDYTVICGYDDSYFKMVYATMANREGRIIVAFYDFKEATLDDHLDYMNKMKARGITPIVHIG
jgi:hypothetical protein